VGPSESRWARAKRDTNLTFRREACVAVIIAGLAWKLLPEQQAREEITAIVLAVVAGVIIFPLLELAWNYLWAPLRIARDRISDLESGNADLQSQLKIATENRQTEEASVNKPSFDLGLKYMVKRLCEEGYAKDDKAADVLIKQEAFLGNLTIYGRQENFHLPPVLKIHDRWADIHKPINRSYWEFAEIAYAYDQTAPDGSKHEEHGGSSYVLSSHTRQNLPGYYDLQVQSKQANAIWPPKPTVPISFREKIREWENFAANYSKFVDEVRNPDRVKKGTQVTSDEQVHQHYCDKYAGLIRETIAILEDHFSGEAREKFKNMTNNKLFSPETIGLDEHARLLTTVLRNFQKNYLQYIKP